MRGSSIIKLEKSNQFRLKLLVTGSHLLKNYGYTFKEINKDSQIFVYYL